MAARRSLLLFAGAVVLCAQTLDLSDRVRRTLGSSDQAEAAAAALANKNYAEVDRILAGVQNKGRNNDHELLAVRASIEFLEHDMTRSALTYSQAARLAPLSDGDSFTFAMALASGGDADGARVLLNALSASHPKHALYLYWLGRLDYYQRRYENAVSRLLAAAQFDPGSTRIWDSLGLAYDMQGQTSQALQALQKSVSLNRAQTHPSPWPPNDLGSLLLRLERPSEAEQMLRESLRYDPEFAQAHYLLGRALEKQNRLTDAIAEYRLAVSGDSASPDACYSLAQLLRKAHRDDEAATMFAEFTKRKQRETTAAFPPLSQ